MEGRRKLSSLWGWLTLPVVIIFAGVLSSCSPSAPPKEARPKTENEVLATSNNRYDWRLKTLVGEYDRVGHKDARWDDDAHAALQALALIEMDNLSAQQDKDAGHVNDYLDSAMAKGCDDPLIVYLHSRNIDWDKHSTNELIQIYNKMAMDMNGSGYCDYRKAIALVRASTWLFRLSAELPEAYFYRREAIPRLAAALDDKDIPPGEVLQACIGLLKSCHNNPSDFPAAYQAMEKPLFENFSKSSVPYAIKGYYYIEYAWKGRGGGYADKVSKDGWKLFAERLAMARTALEKGWQIDPSDPFIPTQMIRVAAGEGNKEEFNGTWFYRAMAVDTNNWEACKERLWYLQPRWYGSYQEMLDFGHECMTNDAWGPAINSYVVDVHQRIADSIGLGTNYWHRPGVWSDIHQGFEKFFQKKPDNKRNHYNYAWYANACGAWDVLNEQIKLLPEPIDYDYFGGREEFEAMRARAAQKAAKK